MRRIGIAGTTAAAALVATAGAALAAGTPRINSPFDGGTVTGPTPVEVTVDEECGPLDEDPTQRVDVRLSADGSSLYPGSSAVALDRTKACTGNSPDSEWDGAVIDPASPTAFFGAGAPPMCNGRWRVQPRADGGAWAAGVSFVVSRPPAAPTGIEVTPTDDTVAVTWTSGPEPDLAGYRVERRKSGVSAWTLVDNVGAGTSRVLDRGLTSGDYEYRVLALRPDGLTGGAPAAPCQDQGPDLQTSSPVAAASVGEPEPAPSPGASPSPGTGSGTDGDGSDGDGSDGDGSGDGSDGTDADGGSDGGAGEDGGDGGTAPGATDGGASDGQQPSAGGSGSTTPRQGRVAPPPPAGGGAQGVQAPGLADAPDGEPAQAATPRERYYGEDLEFSEELDFGSVDPVGSTETRRRATVEERVVPQAVRHFVERFVDPDRVLKPVAVGLLLMVMALHLVRWMRESDAG